MRDNPDGSIACMPGLFHYACMLRIVAVVCARMGSERLPGKMLREVLGVPLLGHLLDRARQAKRLDAIVVATPDTDPNDPIEHYCTSVGLPCFRGPEDDVVSRMLGAFEREQADVGVELYGDSPLIDPRLIEECIDAFLQGDCEWTGNDVIPVYPSGMYCEAFAMSAFRDASRRNTDPAIREHGTLYLRQHPELYRLKHLVHEGPLKRTDLHLDIDTEEDLRLFAAIIEHFAPRKDFSLAEIIAFLDTRPDLARSNAHVQRRWKQYQSRQP